MGLPVNEPEYSGKIISKMPVYEFHSLRPGQVSCKLDLESLYPNQRDLNEFNARWMEFMNSDQDNARVFTREGNRISYIHKSWIPNKENGKPRVLFLFGNSASHSVISDKYFAYEGNGNEHRFWRVIRELRFSNLHGKDQNLKEKFLGLEYEAPFSYGFEVIFTFPSSASQSKWSGVDGVKKLFRSKLSKVLLGEEKKRILAVIKNFLRPDDVIIAMQKDAYNAVSGN